MLNSDDRSAIASYRYKRAVETMDEVRMSVREQRWNLAANRLYYAAFYAMSAVLIREGESVKTHNGVLALFGKRHIHTNHLSRETMVLISRLSSMRHAGDYDDFVIWTEKDVLPNVASTEKFIHDVGVLWCL